MKLYAASDDKISFFAYDNDIYRICSYAPRSIEATIYLKGSVNGIEEIESGRKYTEKTALPLAGPRMDSCVCIPEEPEYAVKIQLSPGETKFFRMI